MTRRWNLDQLATNAMLADRYGVNRSTITNWRNRYDDFPNPVHEFSGTPVWDVIVVDRWHAIHEQHASVQARHHKKEQQ